ncbi:MAG: translation initiation factor IF-2, partial [Oscillibacter sp.]|nr:translation initiation factor IF-2 [Oscillibacter sp.]
MSFVKYRLKEVATDFGTTPKEIADIIAKYYDRPKSNTQVLNDNELNAVFDHMTRTHQIADLSQIFAVAPTAKKAEPKTEAPKAAAPRP